LAELTDQCILLQSTQTCSAITDNLYMIDQPHAGVNTLLCSEQKTVDMWKHCLSVLLQAFNPGLQQNSIIMLRVLKYFNSQQCQLLYSQTLTS